eukprot:jgi/Mesvir1/14274/Mv09705-RA.1
MIEVVRQLGNAMNARTQPKPRQRGAQRWGCAPGLPGIWTRQEREGRVYPNSSVRQDLGDCEALLAERRASQGRRGRRRRQGRGAEETDKWGPDQKNFMQRWLFWCEDPLKPVVDGKPAIAQDIAARQDFLDARPKDKAHELSIFTAHRELASFQYFDSLIQAPIMSGEAPPSNLIKIMEVAKNLIEAAKQFAHIKFLEKPELIGSCRLLNGTFDPVW